MSEWRPYIPDGAPSRRDFSELRTELRKKRRWLQTVAVIGAFGIGLRVGGCRSEELIYPPGATRIDYLAGSRTYEIRVSHDDLSRDERLWLYRIARDGEVSVKPQ